MDVAADPERPAGPRVLTTPPLGRKQPAPPRRITGDLSDIGRVADALDIDPDARP